MVIIWFLSSCKKSLRVTLYGLLLTFRSLSLCGPRKLLVTQFRENEGNRLPERGTGIKKKVEPVKEYFGERVQVTEERRIVQGGRPARNIHGSGRTLKMIYAY